MGVYNDYLENREQNIEMDLLCYRSAKASKVVGVFDVLIALFLILLWCLSIYIIFFVRPGESLNKTVAFISIMVFMFVPVYFVRPFYKEYLRRKSLSFFHGLDTLNPHFTLMLAKREAILGSAVVAFSSLIEKGTITVSNQKETTQEFITVMDAILLDLQPSKYDLEFKLIQRQHQGAVSTLPAYWNELKKHPVSGYWYSESLSSLLEKIYCNHK